MAEFKVIADKIRLFPHPGADKLLLGKVGPFQVVVGKDNDYKEGDIVIFAPERSILPDEIKGDYCNTETGVSYLGGPDSNRVKRVRLRGEYSDGVTLNRDWVVKKLGLPVLEDIALNYDYSEALGIKKYEPPIPFNMSGQLERIEGISFAVNHDVEQFRLYADEFIDGEPVIANEKINGSQVNIQRTSIGRWYVTSKGIGKGGLAIQEAEGNLYWQALNNSGLRELLDKSLGTDEKNQEYQFFGEVFPCQKGYNYGQDKATLRLFRLRIDGREIPFNEIKTTSKILNDKNSSFHESTNTFGNFWIKVIELWVPVIYVGPFNVEKLVEASKGLEQVSGKQLHIREGVVVSPQDTRRSKEGFPLLLKIINPKYKDTDESFS